VSLDARWPGSAVSDWRVFLRYEHTSRLMIVLGVRRRNEGTYRD
jgi:hypothetical protein